MDAGHGCCNLGCSDDHDKHAESLDGHHHEHLHGDESKSAPQDDDDSLLCLAVVRENGVDVVLFDATGTPRSFSYKGDWNDDKLCFSSHGHSEAADDLLTPCFDEDGMHGVPEEGCFCGVDTPHLHAHLHNPIKCVDKDSSSKEDDISYLAQLTLHPTNDDSDIFEENESPETKESRSERVPLMNLPVSDRLPKQCNSKELKHQLSQHGMSHGSVTRRRMHKVQHDDHVDYLVHNGATGGLQLEHPCGGCGQDDVHGNFNLISKRGLSRTSRGKKDKIQLHFFEVASSPFHILDYLKDVFNTDTERVMAARSPVAKAIHHAKPCCANQNFKVAGEPEAPAVKPCCANKTCNVGVEQPIIKEGVTTVRSQFVCTRICCSSEVPSIKAVLEPMDGVNSILINVPLKTVYVDHDPSLVTASDIESILNRKGFDASVQRDGATDSSGSGVGRSHFFVEKICCASEIPAIRCIIEPLPGIENVAFNVTTKMVYVDHDTKVTSADAICDALNRDRFGAHIEKDAAHESSPVTAYVESILTVEKLQDNADLDTFFTKFGPLKVDSFELDASFKKKKIVVMHNPYLLTANAIADALSDAFKIETIVLVDGVDTLDFETPDEVEDEEEATKKHGLRHGLSIPVILSGVFWGISLLSLIGGNWEYLEYLSLVAVAFGLPSIAMKACRTLRRYQFDANCMMLFAALGAIGLQDFTEAGAVTFLFSISEWLEVQATTRARNALSEIVRLRPDRANLIHPGTKELVEVSASAVPVGALVSVRFGDKIPCDGVVVDGRSTVDESSLTGESRPVRKGLNDVVSGGTINTGHAPLTIRTTSTVENSAVARLIRLVEEAQANRSPTEKLVDEFAKRYTPVVIFAALCMVTIPWAWGKEIGRTWTENGLVLIIISCPCALIISTPVSHVAGLAATAQRGVLVKGGAHLEALGLVKKICFDKTGTLTEGCFALLHLNLIENRPSREEVLQYLAVMEEKAAHPLSEALVAAAKNENVTVPTDWSVSNHTDLAGEGVTAVVNGSAVYVGNERLFRRLGLFDSLSAQDKAMVEDWVSNGGTVGFMSIEGEGIVCAYCVADAVRPESASVVSDLKSLGVEVTMLTGDNHDAAIKIGRQVNLTEEGIRSELLPEDKLTIISEMKQDGASGRSALSNPCSRRHLVLMCGDGVNDSPALANADVGVAMGSGAALAMETSDVTLLDSHLTKLVYSIRMGRRVIRKIKENVIFSLVAKAVVVGFAFAGKAALWAAIASDVGAMLIVTLNGMLLLPRRKEKVIQVTEQVDPEEDVEKAFFPDETGSDFNRTSSNLSVSYRAPSCLKGCCGSHTDGLAKSDEDCGKVPASSSGHGSCSDLTKDRGHLHDVNRGGSDVTEDRGHSYDHCHAAGACTQSHGKCSALNTTLSQGHGHDHGHPANDEGHGGSGCAHSHSDNAHNHGHVHAHAHGH